LSDLTVLAVQAEKCNRLITRRLGKSPGTASSGNKVLQETTIRTVLTYCIPVTLQPTMDILTFSFLMVYYYCVKD